MHGSFNIWVRILQVQYILLYFTQLFGPFLAFRIGAYHIANFPSNSDAAHIAISREHIDANWSPGSCPGQRRALDWGKDCGSGSYVCRHRRVPSMTCSDEVARMLATASTRRALPDKSTTGIRVDSACRPTAAPQCRDANMDPRVWRAPPSS
ncbi:hypothetical protein B0H66DRAFT_192264 [Apodospora peruviana]|uniref:Uncharacterized protein n=1 Tax=Apodospora peruviana TaxID=516989 RepID=A0AAE0IBW7_9PEZI|nr:hypothetical protein B0H66DRAFT_192264 [Apodospora peruviana]